jgi:hypothetical protein
MSLGFRNEARWFRRWAPCPLKGVSGALFSNNDCGYHQLETDASFLISGVVPNIHRHHALHPVGWRFIGSAGFAPLGIYRARRAGGSYLFTNALGDSFRYVP